MFLFIVGPEVSELSGIPSYRNYILDHENLNLRAEGRLLVHKEEFFADKEPSKLHYDISEAIKGDGFVITQNLDCLLEKAGVPDYKIIHTDFFLGHPEKVSPVNVENKIYEIPNRVYLIGVKHLEGLGEYLDYTCSYKSVGNRRFPYIECLSSDVVEGLEIILKELSES